MKKTIFLLLMLVSGIALGQDYRSGDTELDASLKIVNTNANKDLPAFKANLIKTFNATTTQVEACFKLGMDAGDAFMAFQVANIAKRPVEQVITVYRSGKSKGWGAMAKELGIKPGSEEFHALKGKVKDKSKGNSKPKATGSDKKENSGGKGNGKSNGNSGKSNGKGKK